MDFISMFGNQSRTSLFNAVKEGDVKRLVNIYATVGAASLEQSISCVADVTEEKIDKFDQVHLGKYARDEMSEVAYTIKAYKHLQRLIITTENHRTSTRVEHSSPQNMSRLLTDSNISTQYSSRTDQKVSLVAHKILPYSDEAILNKNDIKGTTPLPQFPILSEISSAKENKAHHNRNFIPRKHSKRRKNLGSLPISTDKQIVENLLYDASQRLSNLGPPSNFVVYREGVKESLMNYEKGSKNKTKSESRTPIFDGAVSVATPIGNVGSMRTRSGGSGTILHLACALDSAFILAVLLALGADPSSRHTIFQRLLIHEAAACDSPNCLSLLLKLGKKYNEELYQGSFQNQYEDTTTEDYFHYCAEFEQSSKASMISLKKDKRKYKHLSSARSEFTLLLQRSLDLSWKIESKQLSELEAAYALLSKFRIPIESRLAIVATCNMGIRRSQSMKNVGRAIPSEISPSKGTQNSYADGHGNSPLHWASFKNATTCVSLLLSYEASPNDVAESSGWTPLHDASYSDSAESIILLLEAGADVDKKALSGATPLCFAAQEDSPNATLALLKAGANASIRCCGHNSQQSHTNHSRFSGYSALHYCAHYNSYQSARIILDHSFQICQKDRSPLLEIHDFYEKLPLHVAVSRASSDVLKEFLHFGARLNTESDSSVKQTLSISNTSTQSSTSIISINVSEDFDSEDQDIDNSPSSPHCRTIPVVTPVSSPLLRSMIPTTPISSSKPWNCLSQQSIDECKLLLKSAELNWAPERHSIFHPADRLAVIELLRVGKRLEQMGTGIFSELWTLILSYCGRGWFESTTG